MIAIFQCETKFFFYKACDCSELNLHVMTSRIWTIEDVRYLRESPSTPIKRNDASLAVFSYTRARVSPLVSSIMGHR